MQINEYLKQIKKRYNAGIFTEHRYRGDLQVLLTDLEKESMSPMNPKGKNAERRIISFRKKRFP